jgi:SAM-dependent methyltransferase
MTEFSELIRETGEIWDANADFWDQRMGEGNLFHRNLIEPTQLRLLDLKPGELVLDIACGNGQFARKMASLGARVVASDVSERMIANAKQRTTENADRIEYHVIDATDEGQLMALGEGRFDAAVCTMAIMDIASIEPLILSVRRLLKSGGRFVFSLTHPCFNSTTDLTRVVEREVRDGELMERYFVKISDYSHPHTHKGLAMVGQPVPHNYFHRPISVLLNAFFKEGFVLDGIEEPVFDSPERPDRMTLDWDIFSSIPPVLAARLRVMSR